MEDEEPMSESGKIYRNSLGIFCFVCVHCGNYFDDINETLEHIETHFSDGTIDSEEVFENDDKSVETTKLLDFDESSTVAPEFISITTNSLKVEPHETRHVACTDWMERNAIESYKDSSDSHTAEIVTKAAEIVTKGITKIELKQPSSKKKTINCPYCCDTFTHELFLAVHTKKHLNNHIEAENLKLDNHLIDDHMLEVTIDLKVEESLECKICRRCFKAEHLLKRHLQRSTCKDEFCIPMQVGEFPFYCDICGHGFPYKFRLIHHMAQRHTGKETQCKYCFQKYVLESSLQKHEMYDCPQRPDAAEGAVKKVLAKRRISSDAEHDTSKKSWGGYRTPKNVQGPKMFNCEFCDKIYDTHYKLKQHLLSHANLREFKCDQCDCAYNTKPRLRRHYIYNHTDHPTFDCEVCGWKFREKNNLKRHMRLHNGDYQAQCQICSKKFTANCHLKYHMMTAHSSETPFQCDLCGKSFNSTSKMNAHRRRHIKETLPCDLCGKVFGSRNRLYTHKKTHSEERNIICKVCGKNFKTAVVLRQHMYLHKGKIFGCNFCPMTFAQSSGRRTHEKLRHNIV